MIKANKMLFKPRKIIDPATGKERVVSPEEQELMLEKGILLDIPSQEVEDDAVFQKNGPNKDQQKRFDNNGKRRPNGG